MTRLAKYFRRSFSALPMLLALSICNLCLTGLPVAAQESTDIKELQQQYNQLQAELRKIAIATQQLGFKYMDAANSDIAYGLADEYEELLAKGNAVVEEWMPVGEQLFNLKLKQNLPISDELTIFMTKLMMRSYDEGQYLKVHSLCKELYRENPENIFAEVYSARAGMLTNRFDSEVVEVIQKNAEFFQDEEKITQTEQLIIKTMYYLESIFEEESKLRKKDAEKDNLPRVEFKTNKGSFVIELFEDEAPETVGNFISLVESKHFDDLIFHTVLAQTAAETGLYDEKFAARNVGYKIYDENKKPNSRKVFAGSVAMYRDKPNSASSRFFVALAPLPNLNDQHTVFGRVISGMDSIYSLNKTYKFQEEQQIKIEDVVPDKVLSASILRKRDHEYAPRKVKEE